MIPSGPVATPRQTAKKLLDTWARRPSRRVAASLRAFYGRHVRKLPLPVRAELGIGLGEAAEMEGRFEAARYLFASAVTAIDPRRDERLYARAALRALVNARRLGDVAVLSGVAKLVEKLPDREVTPRLAGLGAMARGLERLGKGDADAARRSFEAAMSATWESGDADAEALAHHHLAQAWARIGKVARANEHLYAAGVAARRSNSWVLQRRMELDMLLSRLSAVPTAEALAEARKFVSLVRTRGFPRLESAAWSGLALRVAAGKGHAEIFLAKSEQLLPDGHPERAFLKRARKVLKGRRSEGGRPDRRLIGELKALAKLARK